MADTPGVQQLLAPDSALPEIPHNGTVWKVGRPDQDAKARLEKLVKKVAIDGVRALREVLEPGAYREMFDSVAQNLKQYDTWRAGWQAVALDPANAHLFLWSLLQAHHPNVTEAQVLALGRDVPEEVGFALVQVVPDFFRVLLSEALVGVPAAKRAEVEPIFEAALATLRDRLTPTPATPST